MNLWIVDRTYTNLAIADTFESVIWTERFGSAGEFEIKTPITKAMNYLEFLVPENYFTYDLSDTYMIIEDVNIKTEDGVGYVYITGRDLKSLLDRRVVSQWHTFTGSMQDMVQSLFTSEIINPLDEDRKIENFVFTPSDDSYITSIEVDTQVLGDNLLELIETLCEEASIGFKMVPIDGGGVEFSFINGVDRSYDQDVNPWVVFSPSFGNIKTSQYYVSEFDHKTAAYIAGEGEGAERVVIEVDEESGGQTGLDRRETFFEISVSRHTDEEDEEGNAIELTDDEYLSQLAYEGSLKLAEHVSVEMFDGEVDATRQFVYKEDFNIGDVVQIVNEWGLESYARITEVVISDDSQDGFKMTPTFTAVE